MAKANSPSLLCEERELFSPKRPPHDRRERSVDGGKRLRRVLFKDSETEESLWWWYLSTCDRVKVGIQRDLIRLENTLRSKKDEYEVMRKWFSSQKRFSEMKEQICYLESQKTSFPLTVILTMSKDIDFAIKSRGALPLLRTVGTKDVANELSTDYIRRWKTLLFRRAVYEYLLEINEKARWNDLKSRNKHAREWLVSRFEGLIGETGTTEDDVEFIVSMLFPKRKISCPLSNSCSKQGHYGAPESAKRHRLSFVTDNKDE